MSCRVQVILDEDERELFRAAAERAGVSLSGWLRHAGWQVLQMSSPERLRTVEQLDELFANLPEIDGREPDWAEHESVIEQSRSAGKPLP